MASASEAKSALLGYLRFQQQMPYVATEVTMPAGSLGDVVCANSKVLVEYEVKVSMTDFKADFKKQKHYYYVQHEPKWEGRLFTRGDLVCEIKEEKDFRDRDVFYIYDPSDNTKIIGYSFKTEEQARKHIEEEYSQKDGIPNQFYYVMPKDMWELNKEKITSMLKKHYGVITFFDSSPLSMEVQVIAKKLHHKPPSAKQLLTMVKRMSSELAGLTKLHYDYVNDFSKLKSITNEKFDLKDIEE